MGRINQVILKGFCGYYQPSVCRAKRQEDQKQTVLREDQKRKTEAPEPRSICYHLAD